jgi:hypothetical protein
MGAESIQNVVAAMVQDGLTDHLLLEWCVTIGVNLNSNSLPKRLLADF